MNAVTVTVGAPVRQALPVRERARTLPPHYARLITPTLFAVANAIAFFVVRPDVNDLWAARARASAVSHGVGLTYWFSWFGGGSTPGNYSVLTPQLCAWIGTELVAAIAAVAVTGLATLLVAHTRHPLTAAWFAAVAAGVNLWSGRVAFLLGAAVAAGAVYVLRRGWRVATVALTFLAMLTSPVSGAFVALGLSGTFLTTRTRAWRPIIAYSVITTLVALGAVSAVFGAPGPEPFSLRLAGGMIGALLLLRVASPPDHLRTTIWVTLLATIVVWAIPNGMGSNLARLVWFCLPVAIIATSYRRAWVAGLLTVPLLLAGSFQTYNDLRDAAKPVSTVGYYTSLARQLRSLPDLQDYRVEVVNHGAHAGYDALLPYAMLARGWETQEDESLNKALSLNPLPPTTYKVWLDNNAVGYVALPSSSVGGYPEYRLVRAAKAPYLERIWHDRHWQLFKVRNPSPIAGTPATVVGHSQSAMTIRVPCSCRVDVRVRWSKFLGATLLLAHPGHPGTVRQSVTAAVVDDGTGWTTVTTKQPGVYRLSGSLVR